MNIDSWKKIFYYVFKHIWDKGEDIMTENIHDYLYHYTSINTLGFILKNKNIRFNNLRNLDDMDEGVYSDEYGKYCFISSWTDTEEESIEMWKMYSNDMNGIRIKMKSNPFKEYDVNIKINDKQIRAEKAVFNQEQLYNDTYLIINQVKDSLLHQVIYDEIEKIDAIKNTNPVKIFDESLNYNIEFIGTYKNKYWRFQNEFRYIVHILPIGLNSIKANYDEDVDLFIKLIDLPFKDYYLNLDDEAFENMEIVLGPKTNEIDKMIVQLLVKEYNPSALKNIKNSCLCNRLR